jgi:hypothetical protein
VLLLLLVQTNAEAAVLSIVQDGTAQHSCRGTWQCLRSSWRLLVLVCRMPKRVLLLLMCG